MLKTVLFLNIFVETTIFLIPG